jgi:hypothetical protein
MSSCSLTISARVTDFELERLARDFGCQALALNPLGGFLQEVSGRRASAALSISELDVPLKRSRHAKRGWMHSPDAFGQVLNASCYSCLVFSIALLYWMPSLHWWHQRFQV